MLTASRREVVRSPARKLVRGAQFWGGRYDGASVAHVDCAAVRPAVLCVLSDGTEIVLDGDARIAWLHPASSRVRS